jgi:ferredoxin-NADP reductase
LPASARRRAAQTRRDLAAVLDGLRGRHPAPLVDRPPRRPQPTPDGGAAASVAAARELRIVERSLETADAVSLLLEDPTGAPIEFEPGQFFTLLVDIGGRTYRRAYSASSSYRDAGQLRLTIKRVEGGRVSNHINDRLAAGDIVRVLGPSGSFVCTPEPDAARHLVLIGGGSGITPLMAIALAVLADEPNSRVSLLFGNRAVHDVIYLHDLESIAAEHDRFELRQILERPPADWTGGTGRLDRDTTIAELDRLPDCDLPATYFVCGPEPMMAAVREALESRGVAAGDIREERFSSPHLRTDAPPPGIGVVQPVDIQIAGATHEVSVQPGQTLLDAGLAAGLPMPFSCAMGGCGACKVKLTDGDVSMEEPTCLTPSEKEAGYVLACVSRPCSPAKLEVG